MPHVSSSLVMAAIDRIITRAAKVNPTYQFEVFNKDNKGKPRVERRRYRPTLEERRIPSDKLIDDLETGELGGVTLTRRQTYWTGVGVADMVKRQQEKIVITLKPADKTAIENFLSKLISKAKEDGY